MTDIVITNEIILEEIRNSKQDLKLKIEAIEVKILSKIEEVNGRITRVEKENKNIEERLEQLERLQKKNNIIIFGLKQVQQITPESICEELKKLTSICVNRSDLNDVYPLGRQENSPVKVEFLSNLKKRTVLKNTNLLKGSNISISNDLTPSQRTENKILRKQLYIAKQNKQNVCFIKKHKLYVNKEVYTAKELKNLQEDSIEEVESPNIPENQLNSTKRKQRKQEEQPKEDKDKILHPANIDKLKTYIPDFPIPTANKLNKKEDIKQIEKQEEKRQIETDPRPRRHR